MALSPSPRILVLRALGLGDLLTGVPALRALRRACPDHEIVLAAPGSLAPLVDLAAVADRILDTRGLDRLDLIDPHGRPPEVAVNLHGKGPQSHRLLASCGAERLVAFGCPSAGHDGPVWRADEHEVRRWCRLLEEAAGISTDPHDLGLREPAVPAPAPGAVVVHPGAAYPSRRWPATRFAAVARWAAEHGHQVVVTGSAEERELAETVRRGAGLGPEAVLAGRTDLAGLAAEIASACLLVSGDTGIAHLATAYGTPSVLLFGPTAPSQWGPPPGRSHVVLWHGDGSGDPWGSEPDPALLRIGIEEVTDEVERLLALIRRRDDLQPSGHLPTGHLPSGHLPSGRTTPTSV